ncbi:MAG: histidine kinase [Bacteroidota bacterium]
MQRSRLQFPITNLGWMVLFGILAGVLIHTLINLGTPWLFDTRGLLTGIGYGVGYTVIMGVTQQLGNIVILRRAHPLRSRAAVLRHVLTISVLMTTSFGVATLLLPWLMDDTGFWGNTALLIIVGLFSFTVSMFGNGYHYLSMFYDDLLEAEQEAQDARKAALDAELRALRAQINPHFLFNALNTIAGLTRTRPAEAEAVTEDLADLFRYSLRASKQPRVTLADELESVEQYFAIERARFRERLHVEVDVPPSLHRTMVPSLILQPLVENAVKHGVSQSEGVGQVRVVAHADDAYLGITVTDSGPGFDTTDLSTVLARGTGLSNVHARLRYMFGDEAGVTLQPDGVALRIPAAHPKHVEAVV